MATKTDATKLVQMRFRPKTLEHVEYLQSATGISNRTQITATSIALTRKLIEEVKNGGEILIRRSNGEHVVVVDGF